MSDEPTISITDRILRRLHFGLPMLAAMAVGCVLLGVVLFAAVLYSLDPSRVAWGSYLSLGRALVMLGLWGIAIVLTYWTTRFWMMQPAFVEKKIEANWSQGLNWLARQGVNLKSAPCFIVLGCSTRQFQEQVFQQGEHAPLNANAPDSLIDWHVREDAVYIMLRNVGMYAAVAAKIKASTNQLSRGLPMLPAGMAATRIERCEASLHGPWKNAERPVGLEENEVDGEIESLSEAPTRHLQKTGLQEENASAANSTRAVLTLAEESEQSTAVESHTSFQTLDRLATLVSEVTESFSAQAHSTVMVEEVNETLFVDSIETNQSQCYLAETLKLLGVHRYPYSPINGILVVVDPQNLEGDLMARSVGRAIRQDLELIQQNAGVTCPTTVLVSDSKHAKDYSEYCRRVGSKTKSVDGVPDAAAYSSTIPMLGREYNREEIPCQQSMLALVDQAIATVTNRVEDVLSDASALTQPENHRLIRLSIRCRKLLRPLQWLMVESCATLPADTDPMILSGLFFSARGAGGLQSGLSAAAINHMYRLQHQLIWNDDVIRQYRWQQRMVRLLQWACVILSIGFAFQWLR